eukprot:GHVS01018154.1.p1 GENE.GHVS01018154.1~~GHVS01018154.1.p1  ORF type:complete len:105 (-),score=17.40 GHVS01018154.1:160-474(-)
MAVRPPPLVQMKTPKIYYANQVGVSPPTIACFCNKRELFLDSYIRYLETALRQACGFDGTPIKWLFRSKRLHEAVSQFGHRTAEETRAFQDRVKHNRDLAARLG